MPGNANSGRRLRYSYPQSVGERVRNAITSMQDYQRARNAAYARARALGQVFSLRRLCNQVAIRRER